MIICFGFERLYKIFACLLNLSLAVASQPIIESMQHCGASSGKTLSIVLFILDADAMVVFIKVWGGAARVRDEL